MLVAGLACKNRAPDVPVFLSGPTFCFSDTTYTFKTTATDPDGDSVSIRMMWDYLAISDWSGWVASGDTVALTHAWPNAGDYEVNAQARDQKLNTSGWSDTLNVQVVSRYPPGTPVVPIGPNRGGQDSSYSFTTAASHPAGVTVAVRFSWGDGDTSNWSAFVASGETVAMSHVWTTPDTYAVTAQAKDTGNARSQWSASHTVGIRPPDTLRKWRFQLRDTAGVFYSSPAIGPGGTIYVGSADGSLFAVDPDGTLRWRYSTGGNMRSSPSVAPDGTVYVGSDDGYLYALNPNGTLKWRYNTQEPIHASPAVATDGTICCGSDDNSLYAINSDGTLKWRYETGGNVAAATTIGTDGTIYFVSYDGYLYALKGTSPLADSPWPKFHHDLSNTGRIGGGK